MIKATVNNQIIEIDFSDSSGSSASINGVSFSMDFISKGSASSVIRAHKVYKLEMISFDRDEKSCVVKVNNQELQISVADKYDQLLKQLGMDSLTSKKVNEVKAPMPGLVLKVLVSPGQEIAKGDGLFVLEAMKMENIIKSPAPAIVQSIEVETGGVVEKNQVLIRFN